MNGDGLVDFIIGAPGYGDMINDPQASDADVGRAYVVYGSECFIIWFAA